MPGLLAALVWITLDTPFHTRPLCPEIPEIQWWPGGGEAAPMVDCHGIVKSPGMGGLCGSREASSLVTGILLPWQQGW